VVRVTAFTIIAASPKKIHFKVFLDRTAPSRTLMLHMPVWMLTELIECFRVTNLYDTLSKEDITEGYGVFGGIPRYVMSAGEDREALKTKLMKELQGCKVKTLLDSVGHLDTSTDSHKLLQYELTDDTYRNVTTTFASPWVFERLAEKWEIDNEHAMELFVEQTAGVSELGGARGYALERVAHRKLAQGGKFKVRLLHQNGALASPGEVEFKELPTIKFDSLEEIKDRNGAYGQPNSKSFAVVDSVSFSDSEKNGFQITASYKHQPKHKLVKQLVEAVGLEKGKVFRLYFVVPADKFEDYKFQKYLKSAGKEEMEAKGSVKQVEQWVLLMPVSCQSVRGVMTV
jgi:hypothetical protein